MIETKPELALYRRTTRIPEGLTCVDLFSGAGGLAEGFRQAGWSVLAANDINSDAGATFRLNFPEASFFEGPVSALLSETLLEECDIRPGELDCLIGGPPCQSFSYNNHNRSATDARARLFEEYLRLVADLLPKTIVMENVPGILTIDNGNVIAEITARLSTLGYESSYKTLSAEEFGTPQIRKRVFIVASRIGAPDNLIPAPTYYSANSNKRKPVEKATRKNRKKTRQLKTPISIRSAIGDLPRLRSGKGKQEAPRPIKSPTTDYQRAIRRGAKILYNHVCNGLGPLMLKRIKYVPEGGNWRDIPREHLPAGMKRARLSDHTKRYGRLSRNGLASTLLTKCDPHWGAYIHPTQNRTISVREAARLQGFPDRFRFPGESKSSQYEQIGNAVPIPVAKALASRVHSHIKKSTQKFSQYQLKETSRGAMGCSVVASSSFLASVPTSAG